ncbi:MAG TPA: peroxiredoxin [Polyangiaceae bacterium]|jgi:peroxiredoxin Q/BCP
MPNKQTAKSPGKAPARAPAKSPSKTAGRNGPAPGKAAPKFDLEGDDGERSSSKDYAGKWLVLYFYPRDNTPGCTREAQDFTKAAARLKKLGAEVVGVSKDSVQSHCGFKEKIGIGFTLLSDPKLEAHRAYGAWGKKVMYGKEVEGVIRSTFLVGPDGTLAKSWSGVKVDGHVDKVVAAIEELRA